MSYDNFFKALASPTRLALLKMLADEEHPISALELYQRMATTQSFPDVAYHTRQLRDYGVLEKVSDRQVRGAIQTYVRVSPEFRAFAASTIMDFIRASTYPAANEGTESASTDLPAG